MKTGIWLRSLLLIVLALAAFLGGRRLGSLQRAVIIPPALDCHPTFLGAAPNLTVTLSDQFHPKPFQASVGVSALLCTPVTKKTLPKERKPIPVQKGDHLECYLHDVGLVGGNWTLNDQFGTQKKVKLQPSTHLCEPTDKFPAAEP